MAGSLVQVVKCLSSNCEAFGSNTKKKKKKKKEIPIQTIRNVENQHDAPVIICCFIVPKFFFRAIHCEKYYMNFPSGCDYMLHLLKMIMQILQNVYNFGHTFSQEASEVRRSCWRLGWKWPSLLPRGKEFG
jgi:hypothetical protein